MNKSGNQGAILDITDTPVVKRSDDLFGHAKIAEILADYLANPASKQGSVVAITGTWGTGKSSILNLLTDEILSRSLTFGSGKAQQQRIIFIRFEPWLVGSRDALIAVFFGQLVGAIGRLRKNAADWTDADKILAVAALKKLVERLDKFSEVAVVASTITAPLDPTGMSWIFAGLAKIGGSFLKALRKGERSLELEKAQLEEALRATERILTGLRFVVLVDDLDRLEPSEIVETIRLVRAVAALPHVTYILSYDSAIVEHAVAEALHIENGANYLEKVVHFTLPVPKHNSQKLPEFAEALLRSKFASDANFDSRRAMIVFQVWGGRLLKTPRDVKRLVSAVCLLWPNLKDRADLLDLIWIELIKLRASVPGQNLYAWVRTYMSSLEHLSFDGSLVGVKKDAESLVEIMKGLGWHIRSGEDKITEIDAHHLGTFLPGVSPAYLDVDDKIILYGGKTVADWTAFATEKRLGSPRHWRVYFGFLMPDSALDKDSIDRLLESGRLSVDELNKSLDIVVSVKQRGVKFPADQIFQEHLEPRIERMDGMEASNWLVVAATRARLFKSLSAATFTPDTTNFALRARRLCSALLRRLDSDGRVKCMRQLLEYQSAFWFLAEFMRGEMQLHAERNARPSDFEAEAVFDADELSAVKSAMSNAFSIADWDSIGNVGEAWTIIFAWRDCDERRPGEWLSAMLSGSDMELISRLGGLITYSYGESRSEHLPGNYLDYFLDSEEIRQKLIDIRDAGDVQAGSLLAIWQRSSPGGRNVGNDYNIRRILSKGVWRLVFNPELFRKTGGKRAWKIMEFLEGGEIGQGKNNNENTWAVEGAELVVFNLEGKIHSRFARTEFEKFEMLQNVALPAIPGQYIDRVSGIE